MPGAVTLLSSRDNALFKDLKRLQQDNAAYRRQGRVWIEGDHLCRAALARGLEPAMALFSASFWPTAEPMFAAVAARTVVVADTLWSQISTLESPAQMGFLMTLPDCPPVDPSRPTVVLDRVQDAGNVGSILRSAAAFGFGQVLALKGTAALWSAKVLRAGMGAHFGLRLIESVELDALDALAMPLLVTSSHRGDVMHRAVLPWPCAWAFGHEGQGVSTMLAARARMHLKIAQPGGEESLNVAAAAAICLNASASARLQ